MHFRRFAAAILLCLACAAHLRGETGAFIQLHGFQCRIDYQTNLFTLQNGKASLVVCPGMKSAILNGRLVRLPDAPLLQAGILLVPAELAREVLSFGHAEDRPLRRAEMPLVLLDPGHGGKDPGACYGGIAEKDINLEVARHCATQLESRGFRVRMTRENDSFISLEDRGRMCIGLNADIFVSVHTNSSPNPSASGVEVFTVPATFTEKRDGGRLWDDYRKGSLLSSQWQAAPANILGSEGAVPKHFEPALYSVLYEQCRRESDILARSVLSRLGGRRDGAGRGEPRKHEWYVLKYASCPAVLIEIGFITNTLDRGRLISSAWRRETGASVAAAVENYWQGRARVNGHEAGAR